MSLISNLPDMLCEWFSDLNEFSDCSFCTQFPVNSKTTPLENPVIVFGSRSIKVFDNATDETGAVVTDKRIAELDFSIGVHVPRVMGGAECFGLLDSITERLLFGTDLAICGMTSEKTEYIRNTDSLFVELVFTVKETLHSKGSMNNKLIT